MIARRQKAIAAADLAAVLDGRRIKTPRELVALVRQTVAPLRFDQLTDEQVEGLLAACDVGAELSVGQALSLYHALCGLARSQVADVVPLETPIADTDELPAVDPAQRRRV